MSAARRERYEELLADQALVGLSPGELRELEQLAQELKAKVDPSLELTAGALTRSLVPPVALPLGLRERLEKEARRFGAPAPTVLRPTSPPDRRTALVGWLVAAGLAAVLLWRARTGSLDPAEQRAALLAQAGTQQLEWKPTEQAPGASGDVTWSQEAQSGVMRLVDLPRNDPAREQYQLWIFDAQQEHPIDGGVFDVTAGETLVSIDAKLRVAEPTLFAVTREKPGGVVVSDQQRIVLVAQRE